MHLLTLKYRYTENEHNLSRMKTVIDTVLSINKKFDFYFNLVTCF
jgi:hypothetical protein